MVTWILTFISQWGHFQPLRNVSPMLVLFHAGGTYWPGLWGRLCPPVEAANADVAGGPGPAHAHQLHCRERPTKWAADFWPCSIQVKKKALWSALIYLGENAWQNTKYKYNCIMNRRTDNNKQKKQTITMWWYNQSRGWDYFLGTMGKEKERKKKREEKKCKQY